MKGENRKRPPRSLRKNVRRQKAAIRRALGSEEAKRAIERLNRERKQ